MSAHKVSSWGSRSSSHSKLDLLAEVAAGEASNETSSRDSEESHDFREEERHWGPRKALKRKRSGRVCRDSISSANLQADGGHQYSSCGRPSKENADSQVGHDTASNCGYDLPRNESDINLSEKRKKCDRLSWCGELQERFVNAVHHLGLKDAVPKDILRLMQVQNLSREQVASHLQKYRQALKKGTTPSAHEGHHSGLAHKSGASYTQAYKPGTTAIGLPVDVHMRAIALRQAAAGAALQQSSKSLPKLPGTVGPQASLLQAGRATTDEEQFSRIKEYAAQSQAARLAEFTYPSDPPVFMPPGRLQAAPVLDIKPLDVNQSINNSQSGSEKTIARALLATSQDKVRPYEGLPMKCCPASHS